MTFRNDGEDLDKLDPTFVKDLQESDLYKTLVGLWFLHEGWHVTIFATKVRPTSKERVAYMDNGDLEVFNGKDVINIEVKNSKYNFTSVDDFPFPTTIVDVAHKLDNNKLIAPFKIIRLNATLTHCLIIDSSSKEHWTKDSFYNSKVKRERTCYYISKDLVEFKPIPGYVRGWKNVLQGVGGAEVEEIFITKKTDALFFCQGRKK